MGSFGQNSTFFQNSISTHKLTTKTFVPVQHAWTQELFCQGVGGGGGGGGGVQAPQLILQFTEGVQWFSNTYSRGAPTISGGGGGGGGGWGGGGGGGGVQLLISIETHITCDFPGGSGSPIPPLDPHMDIVHFGRNRLRRACAASL